MTQLELCPAYVEGKECDGKCQRLHVCRGFILGDACRSAKKVSSLSKTTSLIVSQYDYFFVKIVKFIEHFLLLQSDEAIADAQIMSCNLSHELLTPHNGSVLRSKNAMTCILEWPENAIIKCVRNYLKVIS